jgi:hypothetical protein
MLLGLVPEADLELATHAAQSAPAATPQAARAPPPPQVSGADLEPSSAATARPAPAAPAPPSATARSSPASRGVVAAAASDANPDAIRRALRAALACAPSNAENLDEEARAACRKRLSEAAVAMGEAKVDAIPPLKRAYYDAVQKAYQDFRAFPTPITEVTHLPGAEGIYDQRMAAMPGHPPGVGCASGTAPPHSLHFKVGPLSCFAVPPSSPLTPEVDVPPADSVP